MGKGVITITRIRENEEFLRVVMVKKRMHIVKRTKGRGEYFYLQHSFRKTAKSLPYFSVFFV
jgi:hypothetical protein